MTGLCKIATHCYSLGGSCTNSDNDMVLSGDLHSPSALVLNSENVLSRRLISLWQKRNRCWIWSPAECRIGLKQAELWSTQVLCNVDWGQDTVSPAPFAPLHQLASHVIPFSLLLLVIVVMGKTLKTLRTIVIGWVLLSAVSRALCVRWSLKRTPQINYFIAMIITYPVSWTRTDHR